MFQEINTAVLIKLNSLWKYDFFQYTVSIFADGPIFFIPIFLSGAWIYYTYKNPNKNKEINKINLLLIFYSSILSIIIALIIQQIITVERPETIVEQAWTLLLKHIPDASFPSDHATMSVAFITSLFLTWHKNIGYFFLPFVTLMNLSRIIAWIHWPSDIIWGIIVWVFAAIVVCKWWRKNKYLKICNQFIIHTLAYIKL